MDHSAWFAMMKPAFQVARAVITATIFIGLQACVPVAQRPHSGQNEFILVGAGDIAQCGKDSADQSRAAQTALLLDKIDGVVFAAGDLAYPGGTASEFQNCYHLSWGRFKRRTLPVPGNHEYVSTNAQPYYDYWGAQAGEPGKGYYATQLGAWRILALNSNIDAGIDSDQARWLRNELTQHTPRCTLAFWHHPLFSSGEHGDDPKMAALWKLLFNAGADLVITAHEHDYERFVPLNDRGEQDDERGMRQFIVGTGGAKLRQFKRIHPHSEVRNNETFGVIKLTLKPDNYKWQFIPVEGQAFHDEGEGRCHD